MVRHRPAFRHSLWVFLLVLSIVVVCYMVPLLQRSSDFRRKSPQPPHIVLHHTNRQPPDNWFARVGEGTRYPWYVIATHHDRRSMASSIVVLGIVPSTMPKDTPFWCVVYNRDTVITEHARLEWNWWMEPSVTGVPRHQVWHQAFGKCRLATPMAAQISVVSTARLASEEERAAYRFPLHVVRGVAQGGSLGLCLSTIFDMGDSDIGLLVEFMELQLLLGVNKVLLYDLYDCSPAFRDAVSYYRSRGVLEVVPWQIPLWAIGKEGHHLRSARTDENNSSFIKYFGQYLQDTDCLYRFMDRYQYLLYIDLDEAVVPTSEKTLPAMLRAVKRRYLHRRRAATYDFPGTVICDPLQYDDNTGIHRVTKTLTVNSNSPGSVSDHSKYIALSRAVTQLWTHSYTETRRGFIPRWSAPQEVARKLHFRKQTACEVDTDELNITQWYQPDLTRRIRRTLQELNKYSRGTIL